MSAGGVAGRLPLAKFVAFAVVCAAFAAWLVITIGNIALFADRVTYEAVVEDATGLVENDAVKVAGVEVGKVDSVAVDRGNALVTFSIRDDIRLGRQTTVGVRWRNLLGLRYLYVYPAGEGSLEEGHRFPVERTRSVASFGQLMTRLVPIQRSLDPEVSNVVVRALAEALAGREARVQRLLTEAGSLTTTLADRDEQIGRILDNGARLAGAYARRDQAIRTFLETFADVSDTLAARNDQIERIVTELDDSLAELERFADTNADEIHGTIDGLDRITAVLHTNHANLEDLVTHLGRGLAFYHRTSRWGQWFNIRVVGFSEGGQALSTERGACLPDPVPPAQQQPGGGGADTCVRGSRRPAGGGSAGGAHPGDLSDEPSGPAPLFRAGLRRSPAAVAGEIAGGAGRTDRPGDPYADTGDR